MATKKTYTVKVQYVFECERVIKADSPQEAQGLSIAECYVCNPYVGSSLPDDTIEDWDCTIQPTAKKIIKTQVGVSKTFN